MGIRDYEVPEVEDLEPWAQGMRPCDIEFVREFLVDLNAKQAMIRSGTSPENAHRHCTRQMRRPVIAKAVAAAMAERAEALNITAKTVLAEAFRSYTLAIEAKAWSAAARFLEMVGRHVDVRAFRDRYMPDAPHDDEAPALNYDNLSLEDKRTLLRLAELAGAARSAPFDPGASRLN